MKSFLNYAKNRFLYNLLRILFFIGLGLLASQFLFIQEVKAASNLYVSLNGSDLNTQGYKLISANTWSVFQVSGLYDNSHSYYRMSVCYDGTITQNSVSSTNVSSISNLYIEKTSIPCSYYNSTYSGGTWTNIYFNAVDVINSNNIATFSVLSTGGSIGLISMSSSSEPYDYMTGQDNTTIIDQNQSIIDGNQEIKDSINNLDTDPDNLIKNIIKGSWYNLNSNSIESDSSDSRTDYIPVHGLSSLTLLNNSVNYGSGYAFFDNNKNFIIGGHSDNIKSGVEVPSGAYYVIVNLGNPSTAQNSRLIANSLAFEQQQTNDKLDQAEETRKGILGKIGDLISYINPLSENFFVYKLIELLLDALKSLFIPKDGFFSEWFDEFMVYVELKLGFLATPFTLFIDFVESYLNLSSSNDVIINIPDISVPNFEDNILIHATSFNWSETLRSKDSLNSLWQLYLDFIDVFLMLNFIGLCERVYNRIFGGDTSNYEYYTVEDSYTYDNSTGEVLSSRRNERTTKKKRSGN